MAFDRDWSTMKNSKPVVDREKVRCSTCGKRKRVNEKNFYMKSLERGLTRCKECVKEANKKSYHKDVEASRERQREWLKKNPEKVKEYRKRYAQKHPLPDRICPDCGKKKLKKGEHRCEDCWPIHNEKMRAKRNKQCRDYLRKKRKNWTKEDFEREKKRKQEWYKKKKDRIRKKQRQYRKYRDGYAKRMHVVLERIGKQLGKDAGLIQGIDDDLYRPEISPEDRDEILEILSELGRVG